MGDPMKRRKKAAKRREKAQKIPKAELKKMMPLLMEVFLSRDEVVEFVPSPSRPAARRAV
jgi:hypothetical protein